jgi:1,4-alpha-glucan branching enzyme
MRYLNTTKTVLSAIIMLMVQIMLNSSATAQNQDITPQVEPTIFSPSTEITVTYDVTGNTLADLSNAWIWVWIPNQSIDAKYNVNPASDDATLTDNAKFTKSTANNETTFSITFVPQDFFEGDISGQQKIGMLLKGNDWSDGQTTDFVTDLSAEGKFTAILKEPRIDPVIISNGQTLVVSAETNENANFSLTINQQVVDQQSSRKEYDYNHIVAETEGLIQCQLAIASVDSQADTVMDFEYFIRTETVEAPRPEGVISGINYHEDDDSKVTLCLLAPEKSSVFVLGEFNDFRVSSDYQMYRDGEYFWLEIGGLNAGEQYAFQYLVDESVYVADPYADMILDPEDEFIPSSIYAGLKAYPSQAKKNQWYFNRLSVIETGQSEFSWQQDNYNKPDKENLMIYELLIRDFFASNDRSYQNLIDTLGYFKRMGVNAIELMPVMEFNGNSSWGYNPTFMFAPDKAYGTKTQLKQFIDAAHQQEIAVILDIVFNHQDLPSPYAAMYFDFTDGAMKPTANNPWFNVDATHPFSVFHDMNHESDYTKHFMDTTLHYWINEYHVDGFRFDLSKGFTQTNSGSDVGRWGQRDQSRIDILKRMAAKVWSYAPDTWLMLEHFADNSEETVLADYGMMLWGNMHGSYKEAILGYHEDNKSNLEWGHAPERGWQNHHLITYMESHDEERQMYEASQFGNSEGSYDVKDQQTALNRVKAAAAFLYLVPGPKMFWQFGELGYDISIEENGRTGEKPVLWNYYNDSDRRKLHDLMAELVKLRMENPIISEGTFLWSAESAVKRITVGDDQMKLLAIGNFDVSSKRIAGNFPEPGTWYDFFSGDSYDVTDTGLEMPFQPGEFHIYTNQQIEGVKPDLVPWGANFIITSDVGAGTEPLVLYPNPTDGNLQIGGIPHGMYKIEIRDVNGRLLLSDTSNIYKSYQTNVGHLPEGLYQISFTGTEDEFVFKLIKY